MSPARVPRRCSTGTVGIAQEPVQRAETVTREVQTDDGPRHALDALVVAVRPD
jgi:hypothetical protein